MPDAAARWRALCELNVIEQVRNLSRTTIVEDAWRRGQELTIHGLVYDLADGRLRDLGASVGNAADLASVLAAAVAHRPVPDLPSVDLPVADPPVAQPAPAR